MSALRTHGHRSAAQLRQADGWRSRRHVALALSGMRASLRWTEGAAVIRWKRSTGDYVESHCGRWNIVLYLDHKVVGSGSTQREAKAWAAQLSERT